MLFFGCIGLAVLFLIYGLYSALHSAHRRRIVEARRMGIVIGFHMSNDEYNDWSNNRRVV